MTFADPLRSLEAGHGTRRLRLAALRGRRAALRGVALAFQLANLPLRAVAWRNVLADAYPQTSVLIVSVGAAYAAGVGLNAYARRGAATR